MTGRHRPTALALAGWAVAVVLSAGSRSAFVTSLETEVGAPLTGWEYLAEHLTDPYLLSYLAVPLVLAANHRAVHLASDPAHRVRYGSRAAAAVAHGLSLARLAGAAVGTALLALGVLAAGRGWASGWGPVVTAAVNRDRLAVAPLAPHLSPWGVVVAQSALLVVSAAALSTLLALLYLHTGSTTALRWASAGVVVAVIGSFHVDWPTAWALVRPVGYATLAQGAHDTGTSVLFLLLPGVVVAGALLVSWRLETSGGSPGLDGQRRRWAVLAATVGAASLLVVRLVGETTSAGESLRVALSGSDPHTFQLTAFVFALLVTLGPVWVLHAGFTDRLQHGLTAELIREGSPCRWLARAHLRALAAGLVCSAGVAALLLGVAWAARPGRPLGLSAVDLVQVVGNGALQITAYACLLALVAWSTGRATVALATIGALVAMAAPPFRAPGLLPSGLASTSVLVEGLPGVLRAGAVLFAWTAAAVIVLHVLARRRDVSFEL